MSRVKDTARMATWRSGYAAVCKTVYTSSILVVASINKISALRLILETVGELVPRRP